MRIQKSAIAPVLIGLILSTSFFADFSSSLPAGAVSDMNCLPAVDADVTQQYQDHPVPGVSLDQVVQLFNERTDCPGSPRILETGAAPTLNSSSVTPHIAVASSVPPTQSRIASLAFGAQAFGPGTIVNLYMAGAWNFNQIWALGTSSYCVPTSSPFPGYSYATDECDWVSPGGLGEPHPYALMRYRFTITLTIFGITSQQFYWYWLNANTDGSYQFGCRLC